MGGPDKIIAITKNREEDVQEKTCWGATFQAMSQKTVKDTRKDETGVVMRGCHHGLTQCGTHGEDCRDARDEDGGTG